MFNQKAEESQLHLKAVDVDAKCLELGGHKNEDPLALCASKSEACSF